MKASKSFLAVWILSQVFLGCDKKTDYLYFRPDIPFHSQTQKVREVTGTSDIDIFWAIGGMTEQETNFRIGIQNFMATFTTKPYTWRMAVCSSNVTEAPYLGMPQIFDNKDPSPTNNFVDGVMNALNGMDDEVIFDPIQKNLADNPSFIRPNATLVVVMTNDAHDESTGVTQASQMLSFLQGLKGGDLKKVVVYGIFGATDLNCRLNQIDEDWNYHGSEFETLINATGGKVFSLCDATFGASLAKLGDDLYQRLDHARIVLDKTPDLASIHVFFHGVELKGGPQETGGIWFYELKTNSVVFYNLDFAKMDTEEVTIQYNEDIGVK
ncbi:MAG: hypothetical protein ACXVA9_05995 [Bdellovibrionales bacterium]